MEYIKLNKVLKRFYTLLILSFIPYTVIYAIISIASGSDGTLLPIILILSFAFRIVCSFVAGITTGNLTIPDINKRGIINLLRVICFINIVLNAMVLFAALMFLPMLIMG